MVKGIALLILFYGFAVLLDLRTVTWVLNNVVTVAFTAAVVIFQPELRRALERMGQTTVWANRLFGNRPHRSFAARCVAERCGCHLRCG